MEGHYPNTAKGPLQDGKWDGEADVGPPPKPPKPPSTGLGGSLGQIPEWSLGTAPQGTGCRRVLLNCLEHKMEINTWGDPPPRHPPLPPSAARLVN